MERYYILIYLYFSITREHQSIQGAATVPLQPMRERHEPDYVITKETADLLYTLSIYIVNVIIMI